MGAYYVKCVFTPGGRPHDGYSGPYRVCQLTANGDASRTLVDTTSLIDALDIRDALNAHPQRRKGDAGDFYDRKSREARFLAGEEERIAAKVREGAAHRDELVAVRARLALARDTGD